MLSSSEGHRFRLAVMTVVAVSIFSTLVARLWYLQVLARPQLRSAVESNSTRTILEPAPRGRIFDSKGRVLADNRVALSVLVDVSKLKDRDATLARLAALLSTPGQRLTVGDLQRRMDDPRVSQYASRILAPDVDKDVAIQIGEHGDVFPGVTVEKRFVRSYPSQGPVGALAPHLVGYLGEASPEDLKADPSLRPGDIVGRGGVEQEYQALLRGEKGERKVEVDAQGRLVNPQLSARPAVRGSDLTLTIDADVQRLTEVSLADGLDDTRTIYDKEKQKQFLASAGAAVVINVETGEVVAEASFPEFDLNAFNLGDSAKIRQYLDPKNGSPLNDRVVGGLYPPGSTWKPIVAATALELSATNTSSAFPCGGTWIIPGDANEYVWHDWDPIPRGYQSLDYAMAHSCDIYFWNAGNIIESKGRGGTKMATYARDFGFDAATGIDLPNEAAGRMPDAQWKKDYHREDPDSPDAVWYTGDAVNAAIGQGDVVATPLQMAVAYSAVVNGGTVYQPHVLKSATDPTTGQAREVRPQPVRTVPVKPQHLAAVTKSMEGVVRSAAGTATGVFDGFPFDNYVAGGKTGTAEAGRDERGQPKQDTASFVGYVGKGHPQYVVAVVIEQGGHGGSAAAPVARRIMESLMGEKAEKIVVTTDSGDR